MHIFVCIIYLIVYIILCVYILYTHRYRHHEKIKACPEKYETWFW